MKRCTCSIIIVTYNSEIYLPRTMECLRRQTRLADQIILADTGSGDRSYLEQYRHEKNVMLVFTKNQAGFCEGNNLGYERMDEDTDFLLLLNPDAFLAEDFLEKAIAYLENPVNRDIAAITGITMGYDIKGDSPNGKYDTTGVFRTWYGRWYERGQGRDIDPKAYLQEEEIPSICGAVYFCRMSALKEVLVKGRYIFDQSFDMYKEDIDLSLRLRKRGWKLFFVPSLRAYHCRGWDNDRKKMPRRFRMSSAVNECRIHFRSWNPIPMIYSGLKYCAVRFLDL